MAISLRELTATSMHDFANIFTVEARTIGRALYPDEKRWARIARLHVAIDLVDIKLGYRVLPDGLQPDQVEDWVAGRAIAWVLKTQAREAATRG